MATKQDGPSELATLEKNGAKREAVSGDLLVTTELEGRSVTVPAVLLAQFPDKLRLELQDPLGGLLALVVLNGDRFWLYEKDKPEILSGPVQKVNLPFLPRGSAEDLVRIFLARPRTSGMRLAGDDTAELRSGSAKEIVAWDGGQEPISWIKELGGKRQMQAKYSDYTSQAGSRFPAKLELAGRGADGRERSVILAWKEWSLSVPGEQKLFQIPQQQNFGRKIKFLP